MLGKVLLAAVAMIIGGIFLGLTRDPILDTLAGIMFATGSTILAVGAFLALAILLRSLLFRGPDRSTRFN